VRREDRELATLATLPLRTCACEGCEVAFEVGPRNEHQKYHCRKCGEKQRKRWKQAKRREYLRKYWASGYIHPKDRSLSP
jgi:uncharacterized paraquat-inducible protein A